MTDFQKRILIVAGPNGAGKTAFAREFLPHLEEFPFFVNADLIAAGLSPFKPELAAIKAGRLRVAQGGHSIPEPVIRQRFTASHENFNHLYKPLVDGWMLYDNSRASPILLDRGGA